MITEKDKQIYAKYTANRRFNANFYDLAKSIYVTPLRKLFVNLKLEGTENLHDFNGPCILAPFHSISLEEPLMGEVLLNLVGKPHALLTQRVFTRHPITYSILEEVPINTDEDASFKQDYSWSMERLQEWLIQGESVLVFNDGETKYHIESMEKQGRQGILPLEERPNSGIPAKLAMEIGCPIVPIAPYTPQKYEEKLYAWNNWQSWFTLLGGLASGKRIPYTLEFLRPLFPQDFSSVGEMKRTIRQSQLEAYFRMRGKG